MIFSAYQHNILTQNLCQSKEYLLKYQHRTTVLSDYKTFYSRCRTLRTRLINVIYFFLHALAFSPRTKWGTTVFSTQTPGIFRGASIFSPSDKGELQFCHHWTGGPTYFFLDILS